MPVDRDERTLAIENQSYRWSYLVMSFGLLIVTAVRALVYDQASWDLLGLVIVGGAVNAGYQGAHRVLTRRWLAIVVASAMVAAVLAAGFALIGPR